MRPRLLLTLAAFPWSLSAQAWLFPKGEGTVSISYQNLFVRDHVFKNGDAHDIGHILSHALTMDLSYSVTDKLGVRMALPFVAGRYYGLRPHQLPIDNGKYHSTFQDFTIDLRYNISRRPVLFTPFFRAVIPSNNYTYFAHSAAGRNQREYHVGTNAGRALAPLLPKAYVQAQYSYAFVERIVSIAPNRSNLEFQLGYFLTPRFSVLGTGQWTHIHSGLDFDFSLSQAGLAGDEWIHHDQIGKSSLLDVGVGAAFAVTPSSQFFVAVARSIEGRNGHLHAAVVTIGMSRTFRAGSRTEKASLDRAGEKWPEATKSFVCTCAKSR